MHTKPTMRIMIDGMTFTLSSTPFLIANFCFCFGSGLFLAFISGTLLFLFRFWIVVGLYFGYARKYDKV